MHPRKFICATPDSANKPEAHRPGRAFTVYAVSFNGQTAYQVVEVRRFAGIGYRWTGTE